MSKPMKKMLISVGIVLCLIFGWYAAKKIMFAWFSSTYTPPPVTVSATRAISTTWQESLDSVGTLTAVNGAEISAELSGIVKEVHFDSGQFVQQGDLLILLDTSVEQATLKNNLAQLKLAQLNYQRDKILFSKNALPQVVLDEALAKLSQAEAGVEEARARIKQKTITAPFSGKLGIRQVNLGEYISAGSAMVSLQSVDPLYVSFNLPEQYVANLFLRQSVAVSVNLENSKTINGMITAINSKIDQTTRNIQVQATIPNTNKQLYPGMFAKITIWLRDKKNVIALPQTAISYSLHGNTVFILTENGKDDDGKPILKVTRHYVKVGERRNDLVNILDGVKAGDLVVTSGQLKLQNDTRVVIDNSVSL